MITDGMLWLLHLFFPRECVHCGVLLDYRNRDYLCGDCRRLLETVGGQVCERCGRPMEGAATPGLTCAACREHPPAFRRARSAIFFTGAGRSLVLAYKYSANPYLSGAAFRLLLAGGKRWYDWSDYDLVLPVPLHPRKVRERGFNQSALLAAGLSREAGVPCNPRSLVRVRYTPSQTHLDREARQENMRGAFRVAGEAPVREASLLLVDDVYTTGSTVNECTAALLSAGTASVDVLTLARAVEG